MEIENTNLGMEEQTADQQENAFLTGLGVSLAEGTPADQRENEAEDRTSAEEAEGADDADAAADTQAEGGESSETKKTAPEGTEQQKEQAAPKTWDVNVLGVKKTVGVDDISAEVIQKGYDYDRIRKKYDEAKPVMEFFTEAAKNVGKTIPEYMRYLRVEVKKAKNMSEEEARNAVDMEDREAAIAAKEAEQKAAETAKEAGTARMRADIADFARAFPDVYKLAKDNPETIPKSVWNDVARKGLTLSAAYSRYVVEEAKKKEAAADARVETVSHNQKNTERSTGSMKSAGNDTKTRDAFLTGLRTRS